MGSVFIDWSRSVCVTLIEPSLALCVQGYMPAFDSPNLPTFLTGHKETIFSHIMKLYVFQQ